MIIIMLFSSFLSKFIIALIAKNYKHSKNNQGINDFIVPASKGIIYFQLT